MTCCRPAVIRRTSNDQQPLQPAFSSDIRPSPPLDVSVHLLPDNRVNISWSAPRRTMVPVRHYVVEYRTTGGEWKPVIDRLSPRNTSLLWTTPNDDPYGVFHFRVFSFGGSLHSVASPVINLITRGMSSIDHLLNHSLRLFVHPDLISRNTHLYAYLFGSTEYTCMCMWCIHLSAYT